MKKYIIGSAPTASQGQIPIAVRDANNHVSRNHCMITVSQNDTVIQDLNSRNGTFVDGKRITSPVRINENSNVMLAGTFRFDIIDYFGPSRSKNTQLEYASFGSRMLAYIIDGFFAGLPLWGMSMLILPVFLTQPFVGFLLMIAGVLVISYFYFVIPISTKGATFGRKMLNIEYLSLDTMNYPTRKTVWIRLIGYGISGFLFGIGFLMPLFDSKQQALHDKIANTIVVVKTNNK